MIAECVLYYSEVTVGGCTYIMSEYSCSDGYSLQSQQTTCGNIVSSWRIETG